MELRKKNAELGLVRSVGFQTIGALYMMLNHQNPLQLDAISRRLQLYREQVSRYLKLLRKTGQVLKRRIKYKHYYELSPGAKEWMENVLSDQPGPEREKT